MKITQEQLKKTQELLYWEKNRKNNNDLDTSEVKLKMLWHKHGYAEKT